MSLASITMECERAMNEEERTKLVGLLECGDAEEARKYADELKKSGVPETSINYEGHKIIMRYYHINMEFVERITNAFKSYNWHLWIVKIKQE